MHYDTHVYARDGDSDNGGLSASGTIAIIVVCLCIAILAFFLFLWRVLYRLCSRKKSNPLPPAQPPVHGRSYKAWVDRKAFKESGSLRGLTYYNLSAAASQGSLTPASSIFNGRDDDARSARSALGPMALPNYSLPNPVLNPYASMISVASSAASEDGASTPHATESVSHVSQPLPSHPTARGLPRTQSRPVSTVSSVNTTRTAQSTRSQGSIIRGPPHSIHSNIQIVLPAPLAPEVYPYDQLRLEDGLNSARSSYYVNNAEELGRRSVHVEQWVPIRPRSLSMINSAGSYADLSTSMFQLFMECHAWE